MRYLSQKPVKTVTVSAVSELGPSYPSYPPIFSLLTFLKLQYAYQISDLVRKTARVTFDKRNECYYFLS